MQLENLRKALEQLRDNVIAQSKANLKNSGKSASGTLLNSIKGSPVKISDNSIEFSIEMEDYGTFIDKGVSGVKVKYQTPYSYKDKMPPPQALDKWIVRRGLAPRDTGGKFRGRSVKSVGFAKSIQYLIARSIFYKGIKPSLFFTKPFEEEYKKLEGQLDGILFKDADDMIDFIIKQNIK